MHQGRLIQFEEIADHPPAAIKVFVHRHLLADLGTGFEIGFEADLQVEAIEGFFKRAGEAIAGQLTINGAAEALALIAIDELPRFRRQLPLEIASCRGPGFEGLLLVEKGNKLHRLFDDRLLRRIGNNHRSQCWGDQPMLAVSNKLSSQAKEITFFSATFNASLPGGSLLPPASAGFPECVRDRGFPVRESLPLLRVAATIYAGRG